MPTVCPTHHACARVVAARPFSRPKQPRISRPSSPTNGTYFQFLSRPLEIHTGVSLFDHSLRFTAPRPFTGTKRKKIRYTPWSSLAKKSRETGLLRCLRPKMTSSRASRITFLRSPRGESCDYCASAAAFNEPPSESQTHLP